MRILLAVAALVLVSGCICCFNGGGTTTATSSTLNWGTSQKTTATAGFSSTVPEPGDKKSCESLGGRWGRMGLAPRESCNLPTGDSGKECKDSSECEGMCLADSAEARKGKCAAWRKTFGCLYVVADGSVHGRLCLD